MDTYYMRIRANAQWFKIVYKYLVMSLISSV